MVSYLELLQYLNGIGVHALRLELVTVVEVEKRQHALTRHKKHIKMTWPLEKTHCVTSPLFLDLQQS